MGTDVITNVAAGHRLVVFTGDLSFSVRKNIVDLDERCPGLSWLVLVHAPRKRLSQLLRSQRLNLQRNGWRWIGYQAQDFFQRLFPRSMAPALPQAPGAAFEMAALLARPNVRVIRVSDIHGGEAASLLAEFKPDLGLSLAAPILQPSVFAAPRLGTINLHKGKLPEFRGMPPAFWELWTDQRSIGCSVHWVNEKLDDGALLDSAHVVRQRYATVRGLQLELDEVGISLVCRTALAILEGRARTEPQPDGVAKTYRKPTLEQQAVLNRRLDALLPIQRSAWRGAVKDGLARAQVFLHCRLGWRFVAPRVTMLLYHRVSDDARDNLTVGVAQFERQMQLLRTHCQVLSIDQALRLAEVPRSSRPLVAVTFDDGYLDNFVHAVPILLRHRIPAAFFVSTGIVASTKGFPHDKRRGNGVLPMMDWEQLRTMRDWGFEIGSHTVDHIDCVAEPVDRVRRQLQQSHADLVRELGDREWMFAYPYGGRHQMNNERLKLVREAGYTACLSAHGGSNLNHVDRWHVLRRGIHWEFSDAAFLRQCLGR